MKLFDCFVILFGGFILGWMVKSILAKAKPEVRK